MVVAAPSIGESRVGRSRPQPFQLFFEEQAGAVARYLSTTLPADEVEECLQESFLAALRAYDDFDGARPRAWVLTIARRKSIDFHRARARRPAPDAELGEQLPAPAPPEIPLSGDIWNEVAGLPEKQRAALVLRFGLDMPHREIGTVLACSAEAARRSVHEGLRKLRQTRLKEEAA